MIKKEVILHQSNIIYFLIFENMYFIVVYEKKTYMRLFMHLLKVIKFSSMCYI